MNNFKSNRKANCSYNQIKKYLTMNYVPLISSYFHSLISRNQEEIRK